MTLIDAVARFIPGVLGKQASAEEDSFVDGLLDCPHYTRPEVLEGLTVTTCADVGDITKEISEMAIKNNRLQRTWLRRLSS